jgi:hypothetical protein
MCEVYNSLVDANCNEKNLFKKSKETKTDRDRALPATTTM